MNLGEKKLDAYFKIIHNENNITDRPHADIYNGLLDSVLFNTNEKFLLIYMLANSAGKINAVNTADLSMKRLSASSKMSKTTVYRYLKSLEEKGVLLKKKNYSEEKGNSANTYIIINYISIWDSKTLEELKEKANKIKNEVLQNA